MKAKLLILAAVLLVFTSTILYLNKLAIVAERDSPVEGYVTAINPFTMEAMYIVHDIKEEKGKLPSLMFIVEKGGVYGEGVRFFDNLVFGSKYTYKWDWRIAEEVLWLAEDLVRQGADFAFISAHQKEIFWFDHRTGKTVTPAQQGYLVLNPNKPLDVKFLGNAVFAYGVVAIKTGSQFEVTSTFKCPDYMFLYQELESMGDETEVRVITGTNDHSIVEIHTFTFQPGDEKTIAYYQRDWSVILGYEWTDVEGITTNPKYTEVYCSPFGVYLNDFEGDVEITIFDVRNR